MDQLLSLYKSMGFSDCQSFIQSGNILFRSSNENVDDLVHEIFGNIFEIFQFEVPVFILKLEELRSLVKENPYQYDPDKIPDYFHVTLLSSLPSMNYIQQLSQKNFDPDKLECIGRSVYLYCPNGYGNSKLTNGFLERKLGVTATTRNWKTINELLRIAEKIDTISLLN